MKYLLTLCLFVFVAMPFTASAQLVVFDGSHASGYNMYDTFKAQLETWGYTVERRTTPTVDNGDADVIVILPEDGYDNDGSGFTREEAQWLKSFVDGGGGLYISICPNDTYWANIAEVMTLFGIEETNAHVDPVFYDQFDWHPILWGVDALGDDLIYCTGMSVSWPCAPIAGDGVNDLIAVYESVGGAIWTSHYYMLDASCLDNYDNLTYLNRAFAWLTSGHVANQDATWGHVKSLFR